MELSISEGSEVTSYAKQHSPDSSRRATIVTHPIVRVTRRASKNMLPWYSGESWSTLSMNRTTLISFLGLHMLSKRGT